MREVLLTPGSQRSLAVIRSTIAPGGGGGDELYAPSCDVAFVHVLQGSDEACEVLRVLAPAP